MALTINVRAAAAHDIQADLVVLGVFALAGAAKTSAAATSKGSKAPATTLPAPLDALDRALGGGLGKLIAKEEFTGKKDQQLGVPTMGRLSASRVVLIGMGDKTTFSSNDQRALLAKAARVANAEKATTLAVGLPDGLEPSWRAIGEGLELGAYRFTKYLTGDRKPKANLANVTIATSAKADAAAKRDLTTGQDVAAAVNLSRDLSNEPPNHLTPAALAQVAQGLAGKGSPLKVTVFDFKEIQRRGMKLLQAVGQGSVNEPRFVHIAYVPAGKKATKRLCFVGKGITFDTGGISIKPAAGMGEMKHDMSGAGNVVGLMKAVAALRPDCEVHGIVAAAENMPDGNAYRPGDVWGSLDGRTVEIVNTDAEGRLILADALAYARALKPDLLVDNATLTGACVVALGTTCTGWYATNDETASAFQAAVTTSGEQMWRMPLLDELRDQLKSDVADIKHTGDRWGGSITAALFLREFIGDVKNWVHADIAGPASSDRAHGWVNKGGTGHGVMTFLSLIESAASGTTSAAPATKSAAAKKR